MINSSPFERPTGNGGFGLVMGQTINITRAPHNEK